MSIDVERPDPEVLELLDALRQVPAGSHIRDYAVYHLEQYSADAHARPFVLRVEVLHALMKSRLRELMASAKRDGLLA